jgi:hypothetical protein
VAEGYPKFSELPGCAGKNWPREFRKLREQIPELNGYLRIERGKGTRIVLPH